MPAPLVAVSSYRLPAGRVSRWLRGGVAVPDEYVSALSRAGGRAVLLAFPAPDADDLSPFDALLLIGGGDVEPSRYGAHPHPRIYGVDEVRDDQEIALVKSALAQGVPTLAVCRGLQVVNVAMGGTLHQHLPDLPAALPHGDTSSGEGAALHPVEVSVGSRLAEAVGATRVRACLSHHHQGVDVVGQGLVATACSPDGLVEALEPASSSAPWLLAVQWHPERTAASDPEQQALFDALVRAGRPSGG